MAAIQHYFVVTDVSYLIDLGFKCCGRDFYYRSKGQNRIWVLGFEHRVSFVHHSFDSYYIFMKMFELGIIKIKEIGVA